ncbi:MAG: iron ABC transporter permease [Bacteroidales bacterium]|jgi:iron complex transport system permease protein
MARSLSKNTILFTGFTTLLLVCFIADMFIGSVRIAFGDLLSIIFSGESRQPEWHIIFWDFRFPRAMTAVFAGISLSLAGLQMQTIFRNPLAGPYVLGISSGASLGVALLVMGAVIILPDRDHHFGTLGVIGAAWIGSGVVMFLLLLVSIRIKDIMTILILGILFGSITIAIVSILQYFTHEALLKTFIVWTLGSLGNVTREQLPLLAGTLSLGVMLSLVCVKILNTFLLGENYARTMGVGVTTGRILLFISTSILAGTITAFCGPIGFIGIAVPHIARLVWKTADHRILIPAVMLLGATGLLISDMISQLPGSDKILPINSITALLGIPVVVWIVVRNRRFARIS